MWAVNTTAQVAATTPGNLPGSYALCSFQGKPALEIWTAKDLERLWWHLQNGNGPFDYVTHRDMHNLLYRLDPVRAYDLRLVKRIEVASVTDAGDFNRAFVALESVKAARTGLSAKLKIDVEQAEGVKRKIVTVKRNGDDLFTLSGRREVYRGYTVTEINAEGGFVSFGNGVRPRLNVWSSCCSFSFPSWRCWCAGGGIRHASLSIQMGKWRKIRGLGVSGRLRGQELGPLLLFPPPGRAGPGLKHNAASMPSPNLPLPKVPPSTTHPQK
jgi:hypothetical protein